LRLFWLKRKSAEKSEKSHESSQIFSQLQIKACMDAADCQPDFCLDFLDQPNNGKRKPKKKLLREL
jgi:hypothetical protein